MLVAHLVPAGDTVPTADELRLALRRTLPDHMVPTAFVPLPDPPLRTRFLRTEDGWRQEVLPGVPDGIVTQHDVAGLDDPALQAETARLADRARALLDPAEGRVARVLILDRGPQLPAHLLFTVHHLVVDGVSWRILPGDLETAHRQAAAGHPVELPPATTAYGHWAARLEAHTRSGALDGDLDHWRHTVAAPADLPPAGPAPTPRRHRRHGHGGTGAGDHPGPAAAGPGGLPHPGQRRPAQRPRPHPGPLVPAKSVLVGVEGHGREDLFDDLDLSRTVGWFTAEFPLALTVAPDADWHDTLRSVKEQLRAVPLRGLSHGALRHLLPDSPLAGAPAPRVGFNYHGQWDADGGGSGLYAAALPAAGSDTDPDAPRPYLLDITGVVQDGRLELGWTYPPAVYDEATVRALAEEMCAALREIAAHCARPDAGGRTPSDFPLAGLGQAELDRLVGDGRHVADVLPLTPLQAGMLFHGLVDTAGAYSDRVAVRLSGVTDPQAFAAAWQQVSDRTEALRTSVHWQGLPHPVQVVHRHVELPVTHLDWRGLTPQQRARETEELLAADRAAGMDLTTAPLTRLTLAALPGDEILLLWSSHHLILDGWSTGQLLTEVCERYAGLTGGRAAPAPVRRPFADFLRWLHDQDENAAEAHWQAPSPGSPPAPRCRTTARRPRSTAPAPPPWHTAGWTSTCRRGCGGRPPGPG
ncbi:NRPS protein OS=Streptomyces glaucescens OX=1907 GN=nrps2B PE=4 SV=1 [Streptomyces glaucescens]